MRKAFTLIEMMISISILSILMIFLYRSYADLNRSNDVYKKVLSSLEKQELIKKIFYLDFSLASEVKILHQDRQTDIIFLQTKHSIHRRINPYVAYILKNQELYRLESLLPFKQYPLAGDSNFIGDNLGKSTLLRIYKGKKGANMFVLHVKFSKQEEILLKLKALNI